MYLFVLYEKILKNKVAKIESTEVQISHGGQMNVMNYRCKSLM